MNESDKSELIKQGIDKAKEFRKSSGPLFGVCGGIADYTGIPPIIVRVAAVVGIFPTSGLLILAYVLLAIFMPKANKDHLRGYTEGKGQIVQKINRDVSCDNCGEMNAPKRNYCQSCGEALY